MAANPVTFGSDLVGAIKIQAGFSQKMDLAWQRWATRSLFHNKTSLIGHIWRAWNGPAATDDVSWPITACEFWHRAELVGCFENFGRVKPKMDLVWQRWATRS